jgi:hypothetical protein
MPHELAVGAADQSTRGNQTDYMFEDSETLRDDGPEMCMAMDDALPDETPVTVK